MYPELLLVDLVQNKHTVTDNPLSRDNNQQQQKKHYYWLGNNENEDNNNYFICHD